MCNKKTLETNILKRFLLHQKISVEPIPILPENEPPDFIIKLNSQKISIELTRLIRPRVSEIEAFSNRIIQLAHAKFKEKYNVSLMVSVNFTSAPLNGRGNKINTYVNRLYDLVEDTYLVNVNREFHYVSKSKPVNDFVNSIVISNKPDINDWQLYGAFKADSPDIEWISKVIQRKESKIEKYREDFDEKWLVLVANFGYRSSTFDFNFPLSCKLSSTLFDQIYLYQYINNSTAKIK